VQPEFIDPTLSWSLRVFLAFVLGRSLLHKLRDPAAFRDVVRDYRLLPTRALGPAALGIVIAEALVTLGLLFPATRGAAGFGAMALFLLYGGAISLNLARGRREIDCGCSGPLARGHGLHEWLVARNAGQFLFAALVALPTTARALGWLDGATVLLAVSALASLSLAVDGLAASAARTRLEPAR